MGVRCASAADQRDGLIALRTFGYAAFYFDANLLLSLALAAILPLLLMGLYLQSKELLAVQMRARELASTDALTGLLTSHLFSDRVRAAVGRCRKSGHNAVVLYVRWSMPSGFANCTVARRSSRA